ncbi:hypothetical protein V7S43_018705 [Phytophthora oleae]|uniref:Uncharacterized protein n=1 Tax=Phytophthora oleae TaxID=2107226 RepID=A0ABD3EPP1_9STRA
MSGSEPEVYVPSPGVWEAPPITEEWQENGEAFKACMEGYQGETHQLFRMRSSTSVDHRNKEITALDGAPLIPSECKTFWAKLICTHGW